MRRDIKKIMLYPIGPGTIYPKVHARLIKIIDENMNICKYGLLHEYEKYHMPIINELTNIKSTILFIKKRRCLIMLKILF